MRLILIRHGETCANVLYNTDNRILIGALENEWTQLNEMGRKQAKTAKSKLEGIQIDEVYCSPLGRARETASILFPECKTAYTDLLKERSLGSDEGKRASEVFADPKAWHYHVNVEQDSEQECFNKKVPDGENYRDVTKRCVEFLNQLDFNEDKTIAVVAHFHLLRCLIYVLEEKALDKEIFNLMIPNASPILYDSKKKQFLEL